MTEPVVFDNGARQRDLSALSWILPSMHAALADAVRELDAFVAEAVANPHALGLRDNTALRLASQHLHQAAGALTIVGLRGLGPYCTALERLLDAIDRGSVAADAMALRLFGDGVQALDEYVQDIKAGEPEEPVRLFRVYADVLEALRDERIHPADLWGDELQALPPILLPSRDLAGVQQARLKFETALLNALRAEAVRSDIDTRRVAWGPLAACLELVRMREREARRDTDDPARDLWLVLKLVFGAVARGMLEPDLLIKRLAARVNLLLREYAKGLVQQPPGLLTDALYLLASIPPVALDRHPLGKAITASLAAFGLPLSHLPVRAAHGQRYHCLLSAAAVGRLQASAASLTPSLSQDSFGAALQALNTATAELLQPELERLLTMLANNPVVALASPHTMWREALAAFLSDRLAHPWRIHAGSGHAAAHVFADECRALCDAVSGFSQSVSPALLPWLVGMADQARQRQGREAIVSRVRSQLDVLETQLEAVASASSRADGTLELAAPCALLRDLAHSLAGLDGSDAAQACDALADAEAVLQRLQATASMPTGPVLDDVAVRLGWIRSLLDTVEFAAPAVANAATPVGGAHLRTTAELSDAVISKRFSDARSLLDSAAPELVPDTVVTLLRVLLRDLDDQATIDEDTALKRRVDGALTQLAAWVAGSASAYARLQAALAPPSETVAIDAAETYSAESHSADDVETIATANSVPDIDVELLEFFLEEADSTLDTVDTILAAGLAEADALAHLRRSFHTLKGSGRMVGLMAFGEAAWAIEQVLNLWLAERRPVNDDLVQLLRRACDELRGWVHRLHGRADAPCDVAALIAAATDVRRGLPPESAQPAVAAAEEVHADDNVILFPFASAAQNDEDSFKVIGPVRLGLALYNVYLQEADDLIRQLATDVSEWRHEARPQPSELAMRVVHTLQGSSSTVGLEPVCALAEAFESVLLQLHRHPVAMHPGDFRLLDRCIDSMRGMLQSFATGVWPESAPALCANLVELCERMAVRPRLALQPSTPDGVADARIAGGSVASLSIVVPQTPELDDAPPDDVSPDHVSLEDVPNEELSGRQLVPELVEVFLDEAQVALPELGKQLRAWEGQPDNAAAAILVRRSLHTLKGSARMAGAMSLGQAVHGMESTLDNALRHHGVDPALFRQLYVWYDRLQAHVEALQTGIVLPVDDPIVAVPFSAQGGAGPAAAMVAMPVASPADDAVSASEPEPADRQRALVRVQARTLDALIGDAGEVGTTRARLESEVTQLKSYLGELHDNVARLRAQLREIEIQAETQMESRLADAVRDSEHFDPLEFDRFTRFQELTRMMAESVNDVATVQQNLHRGLDRATVDLDAQGRLTRGLQRDLMRARMVQFDVLSDRLYRVARQTALETGKEVRLVIRGGTVEIDRSVLERMAGPLEHLIRNAVVHGIEPAAVRLARGKPATGELTLDVQQEGNEVVLHFADDGGGLDLPRIRARAVERHLIAADAPDAASTEASLTELIFAPGFSTADVVSEVAGRGVGMDVVRAETVALGGRISLQTEAGQGARFTVHLPLTTAITQALLVRLGERTFAFPSGMVDQVVQLRAQPLADAYNAAALDTPHGKVPFHYFGTLLDERAPTVQRKYASVVVVRGGPERVAVHVDDVAGNREVVVKQIGPHLARVEGIAGATTLGDGEIVLIYNPLVLTQRYLRERAQQPSAGQALGAVAELRRDDAYPGTRPVTGLETRRTVMVVDDSLTVRKVTHRLLERAGYHVLLARDGVDALRQLQDHTPDAMLVDIEMPHMDGFDLTRNLRADPRTRHLPIIMITSRTAEKHRNYAKDIGVDQYFGKPYNEEAVLAALARLIPSLAQDPGVVTDIVTDAEHLAAPGQLRGHII